MIGIIGCGDRMKYLIKDLLKANPNNKITAICDINKDAIKKWKTLFKGNSKVYYNYKDLIDDKDVKWILIGTINSKHKNQIIYAIEKNKNIFCEKPLAISIEECKEIFNKIKNSPIKFFMGYNLRYSPHYQRIKEIISSGKIGEIISFEFNETIPFYHGTHFMTSWRSFKKFSGSFLLEKCCHDMDLANWMVNSKPKTVASFGGLRFYIPKNSKIFEDIPNKGELKFKEFELKNPFISEKDIIDHQVAIIEYKNGVKACFHTNLHAGIPERRMYICGTKGSITADLLKGKIEVKGLFEKDKVGIIIDKSLAESHGGGDKVLARELNLCINENFKPKTTIFDAINSVLSCISIDDSMNTKKIINLIPYYKEVYGNDYKEN